MVKYLINLAQVTDNTKKASLKRTHFQSPYELEKRLGETSFSDDTTIFHYNDMQAEGKGRFTCKHRFHEP